MSCIVPKQIFLAISLLGWASAGYSQPPQRTAPPVLLVRLTPHGPELSHALVKAGSFRMLVINHTPLHDPAVLIERVTGNSSAPGQAVSEDAREKHGRNTFSDRTLTPGTYRIFMTVAREREARLTVVP